MSDSGIEQLEELFSAALKRGPAQRNAFLDEACAGDDALKTHIQALLDAHDTNDGFLEVGSDRDERFVASYCDQDVEGRRIGRYTIRRVIATGGMGVVFEADQEQPRRTVALKVMRHSLASDATRQRFQYEVEILGQLQHPNIARIYDAGMHEEPSLAGAAVPYFAMEKIDGRPINEYAQARRLNTRARLKLMIKICRAVHHAHQKGIIHRDLKPGNILVDAGGEPKILDFGVARATDSDLQLTMQPTAAGQLVGTIPYMSPEQLAGDPREVDSRSDVYSLGVLLYELLADRLPHDLCDKPIAESARIVREEEAPVLGTVDRVFRGDIETIVGKALEKDGSRRYQSALDLAADIQRFLSDEPIVARPPTSLYQLQKFAHRNKALVGGIAAAFAFLVLAVAGTGYGLYRARHEQRAALQSEREARAISEFLHNMLSSVDPSRAGYQVTVAEVLDRAVQDLEERFPDEPLIRASLLNTIGRSYLNIGLFNSGRDCLRQAFELRDSVLGDRHPDTLHSMELMADSRLPLEESEGFLRHVTDVRRETLGARHPDTVQAELKLVFAIAGQKRLAEATAMLDAIWEPALQVLGDQRHDVHRAGLVRGWMLQEQGRLQEAEACLTDLLEVCRCNPDKEYRFTLGAMERLGLLWMLEDRFDEAEPMLRQPLEVKRRVLGDHHSATIYAEVHLSQLLVALDRLDEAEPLTLRAVELGRAADARGDRRILAEALRALAALYVKRGAFRDAEPLLQEALELNSAFFGESFPRTLYCMSSLAAARIELGQLDEAADLLERALETVQRSKCEDVFLLPEIQCEYGRCLTRMDRYEEAENLLVAARDAFNSIVGPDNHLTRRAESCLEELGRTRNESENAAN